MAAARSAKFFRNGGRGQRETLDFMKMALFLKKYFA
jgi:hypothetical protein